jgi:transposase
LIAYGLEDPPPRYRHRPRQFSTYQPHSEKGHYEDGLCLFAKRLERGRFVWPQASEGSVALTRAQLSMLLEGIDWRRPVRTAEPQLAI